MENKKILIIDDKEELGEALGTMLKYKGYQTFAATSGKDGLAIALAEHPDLILLDVRMPEMSGVEMLEQLRQDPWGATAKVLILSANDLDTSVDYNSFGIGQDDYLMKARWGLENIAEKIKQKLAE